MKKTLTGKNAVIKVNGKPVVYGNFPGVYAPGMYVQAISPIQLFHDEYDDAFSNKWSIKCDRMSMRFGNDTLHGYGHVYKLGQLLWKLRVWKP
jgi:hypothetical protein